MKVVYVSAYDSAGQRFNGMVLHRALNRMGHRSDFAVMEQALSDPGIHRLGGWVLRRLNRLAGVVENTLSLQATLPLLGWSLYREPYFREADLIHLQLLHARSFISLLHLPRVADGARPVVWTIHDPWILSGHCVHSLDCERWKTGCGACPDLTIPLAIGRDTTAFNWRLKRRILAKAKIHLIVASRWMERRLEQSPILGHLPSTVIPFGVDRSIFRPLDKAVCRRKLGICPDARVLAARWTPWNILKGTQYALEALQMLPPGVITHVMSFDTYDRSGLEALRGKYQLVPLGWVEKDEDVARALSAADVFIMPSLGETFGMMAVEAMACGTPTVVFEGTALPEVVDAPRAGLAVPHKDASALRQGICDVMQDQGLRRSLIEHGLALVARAYTQEQYVQRHLDLYQELIQAGRGVCGESARPDL